MGEVAVGVFVAGLFYTIYKLIVGEAEPDRKGGTRDTGKKKTEEKAEKKTVTFYPPEGPPYEVPYEGEGGYGMEGEWEAQTALEKSLQERAVKAAELAAPGTPAYEFRAAAQETSATAAMGYVPPPKPHDVWEEPTAHGTEILWVDVERSLGERTTQAAGLYGPPARSSSAGMVTTTASPWSRGVETARATAAALEPR